MSRPTLRVIPAPRERQRSRGNRSGSRCASAGTEFVDMHLGSGLRRNDASERAGAVLSAEEPRMRALFTKARIAARSARLLLDAGDTDGAVNRAYYAVFSAARAALATVRQSLSRSKRHGTIFRRFDKHLVEGRGLEHALGRSFLAKQRRARQVADYAGGMVDESMARSAVNDMERFLAAIEPLLTKSRTRSGGGAVGRFETTGAGSLRPTR